MMRTGDIHAVVTKVNGVLTVRIENSIATFPGKCYEAPSKAMHAWCRYHGVTSFEYLESAQGEQA